jgi:hypothetical protein
MGARKNRELIISHDNAELCHGLLLELDLNAQY